MPLLRITERYLDTIDIFVFLAAWQDHKRRLAPKMEKPYLAASLTPCYDKTSHII